IVVVLVAGLAAPAKAAGEDWARVGEALGKAGTEQPGGVYRVGLPRTDIKATLDGVELKPGFALGGWLAFTKMGKDAMVMGDLVLAMDEVNPVMAKLLAGGIEVTALHNHLLRNQPFTMYMHVSGMGDPVKLATALHAGLAASNFRPTGGGKAAITGDFVLVAKEVAPVMKALRDNGIEVTALHNHMLGDEPRLLFMHFWANDDARKLATGLKAALSHIAIAKG